MSLKCSILGHRFGDAVVERSRDESGSEVVITIQEVQTCERCGHERIVSENKEVTTLETPDEPDDDPAEASVEPDESADDPATDPPESEPAVASVPTAESGPDLGAVEEEPDDGVILEDEPDDEPDRDPGAWPEEPGDDGPEWTPPTEIDEPADPDPDPTPTVEPTGEALTVPQGRFRCPSCGFTKPVDSSSLREGDFCPECHTGSLAHERDAE